MHLFEVLFCLLNCNLRHKSLHSLLQSTCLVLLVIPMHALQPSPFASIPQEVRSSHFVVTIAGRRSAVIHAATNYYLLNFDVSSPTVVSVTSDDPHFWDRGVVVQPMRYGIRPKRNGATITFPIPGPIKLSLSRPGEHFAESEMLFLFANPPSPKVSESAGIRYFGPGVHRQNIDAHNRGPTSTSLQGPLSSARSTSGRCATSRLRARRHRLRRSAEPRRRDGWMHKKNWHCIVMDHAHDISIEGITCVVRSRTWQIQMKDSRNIVFDNVKVIGANQGNANADGMDWLGGGDTIVRNSFFRAADDVFAMQSSWEGLRVAAAHSARQ